MDNMDSQQARTAFNQAAEAQDQGAKRATRPGWYYPALGVSVLFAFASLSIGGVVATAGVPLGFAVFPVALSMAANRAAGAAPDRSYSDSAMLRVNLVFAAVVGVLAIIGGVLEFAVDLRWSMAVCGLGALVATVVTGRKLDRMRADRFQKGREQA